MSVSALWRWLASQTLRGLLLLVPLAVTVIFIVWLGRTLELSLKPLFVLLLPAGCYIPGLAVLLFLLGAFMVGLLTRNVLLRKLLEVTEYWMTKLPVVSSIYPMVRQLTDLFSGKNQGPSGGVVLASFPEVGAQMVGIVTAPAEARQPVWVPPDHDLVYIPMSYGIGGFMLVLPRSRLHPLDMKPTEALQMILMGGIGQPKPPSAGRPR